MFFQSLLKISKLPPSVESVLPPGQDHSIEYSMYYSFHCSAKSDIFSLGCVLGEIFQGQEIFDLSSL